MFEVSCLMCIVVYNHVNQTFFKRSYSSYGFLSNERNPIVPELRSTIVNQISNRITLTHENKLKIDEGEEEPA